VEEANVHRYTTRKQSHDTEPRLLCGLQQVLLAGVDAACLRQLVSLLRLSVVQFLLLLPRVVLRRLLPFLLIHHSRLVRRVVGPGNKSV